MYAKENEKTSQVIRWIRRNTTNMLIWDVLCGDSWFDYTVGDCIDMLERVAAAEMYQFALILITILQNAEFCLIQICQGHWSAFCSRVIRQVKSLSSIN